MKKLLAVGLLCIIAGFYFYRPTKEIKPLASAQASYKDLDITVSALGKIYAKNIVLVATLANGKIKELRVKQGDYLHKGDVIALLDDVNEKGALESAKARIANLEDEHKSAIESLNLAKTQLNNALRLHKIGAQSYEQLLRQKALYASAKANVSAKAADLLRAQIDIKTLQKALDDTIVKAPISGVAVAVYATEGQTINSRQSSPALLKIADLTELEVRMKIPQNDALKIKPGQKVQISPIADSSLKISSELTSIDQADTQTIDGSAQEAVHYYARSFIKPQANLKIGMDVLSNIFVKSIKHTLALPLSFIQHNQNGYYVLVSQDNAHKIRPVTLGDNDGAYAQILSGLKENERVYLE